MNRQRTEGGQERDPGRVSTWAQKEPSPVFKMFGSYDLFWNCINQHVIFTTCKLPGTPTRLSGEKVLHQTRNSGPKKEVLGRFET